MEHPMLARPVPLGRQQTLPVGTRYAAADEHDVGFFAGLHHSKLGVDRRQLGDQPVRVRLWTTLARRRQVPGGPAVAGIRLVLIRIRQLRLRPGGTLQISRLVFVEPSAPATTGTLVLIISQRRMSLTGVETRASGNHRATIAVIGSSPPFDSPDADAESSNPAHVPGAAIACRWTPYDATRFASALSPHVPVDRRTAGTGIVCVRAIHGRGADATTPATAGLCGQAGASGRGRHVRDPIAPIRIAE